MTIELNQLISHYQIIRLLGKGGMGDVYLAQDLDLERLVVLKFLSPQFAEEPHSRERFIREAKTASQLNHPNISTIYEVREEDDYLFISMEYVPGESLDTKIKQGLLDNDLIIEIGLSVGKGLESAHCKGIVHRDIKSSNIMISDDGTIKILDFGIAKVSGKSPITEDDMLLGTADYMSPEQARGEILDQQTDIFSLGVALYECATGELPFQGDKNLSVAYHVVHTDPAPVSKKRPEIPEQLAKIIQKALEKRKEKRYKTITEMIVDLQNAKKEILTLTNEKRNIDQILHSYPGLWTYPLLLLKRKLLPYFIIETLLLIGLIGNVESFVVQLGLAPDILRFFGILAFCLILFQVFVIFYKDRILPRRVFIFELLILTVFLSLVGISFFPVIMNPAGKPNLRHAFAATFNKKGKSFKATGLIEKARQSFEKAIEIDPHDMEAWNNLGLCNLETKSFFAAEFQFKKSLELDSTFAIAWNSLGLLEFARGNYTAAIADFKKSVDLDSIYAHAYFNLASVYEEAGNYNEAETFYRKVIEIDTSLIEGANNLSRLLVSQGKYEEAVHILSNAIEKDAGQPYLYKNLGAALRGAKNLDQSITALNKALALNPDFDEARLELALTLKEKGLIDEGIQQIQEVLKDASDGEIRKRAEKLLAELK